MTILTELPKRELLLLAAKAIGFEPFEFNGKFYANLVDAYAEGKDWDPMEDPGDAMLLAIELQISVHNEQLGAGAAYCMGYDHASQKEREFPIITTISTGEVLTKQDYRDTYRAIVYAAATLGLEVEDDEAEGS